jgi:hypothetical protein
VHHAAVFEHLAALREVVVNRQFLQLLGDGIRVLGAGGLDRLQILQRRRIGAGLDHVRHPAGALEEAIGEVAALVVAIPVIALGQHQALGGIEPEAVNFGQRQQQPGKLLAALDDAELGRLLDRVGGVEAGVGKADDLGFRALRLQQERGEVRRVQGDADRTHDLAALFPDEIAGVFLQRITEGVVRGHEEPGIAAGLHQRAAGTDRQRVGVVGPVETVRRAGVAGNARGRRPHDDVDLLLFLREFLDRERHRGRRQFGNHVDVLDLVPAPRDGGGEIRLVLVVGGDDVDRLAEHTAAEILDRHLGGFERILAAVIGVDPGLVVQNADLDALCRRRPGQQKTAHRNGRQQSRLHMCLPAVSVQGNLAQQYFITLRLPIYFRSANSIGVAVINALRHSGARVGANPE